MSDKTKATPEPTSETAQSAGAAKPEAQPARELDAKKLRSFLGEFGSTEAEKRAMQKLLEEHADASALPDEMGEKFYKKHTATSTFGRYFRGRVRDVLKEVAR